MKQDCCEHCSSYCRGPDTVYHCDRCVVCDCLDECFDEEVEE
jgi:hypothetical protein